MLIGPQLFRYCWNLRYGKSKSKNRFDAVNVRPVTSKSEHLDAISLQLMSIHSFFSWYFSESRINLGILELRSRENVMLWEETRLNLNYPSALTRYSSPRCSCLWYRFQRRVKGSSFQAVLGVPRVKRKTLLVLIESRAVYAEKVKRNVQQDCCSCLDFKNVRIVWAILEAVSHREGLETSESDSHQKTPKPGWYWTGVLLWT